MSGLHLVQKSIGKGRLRYWALDWLKLVACVLVVVIHVTAAGIVGYVPGSRLQYLTVIINTLSQFAVPAFIFASGYALAGQFRDEPRVPELLKFWYKRLSVVVLPYVIWTLIYLILQQRFMGVCYGIGGMLKLLLTGGAFYHLYFMVILIQFYLLFPGLLWFRRRLARYGMDVGLVAVVFLVYAFWLKSGMPLSDRFFLSYLPFFYAGMVLVDQPLKLVGLSVAGIAGAVAFADLLVARLTAFGAISPTRLLSMPLAWEIFSLAAVMLLTAWFGTFRVGERSEKWLKLLVGTTFDVYLAHPLILFFTVRWLRAAGVSSLTLEMVLGLLLGVTLPVLARFGYNALIARFDRKTPDSGSAA
ncbi:MAG: acyltransferase [Erysipelotrichaceae bacterium]|nr:acyltransferase [Erysipelotrichaceae bacterium]